MKTKNHPLNIRLPAHLRSQIDRRSATAGQSRSAVIIELIAAGISAADRPDPEPFDGQKLADEIAAIRADLQKLIAFVNN